MVEPAAATSRNSFPYPAIGIILAMLAVAALGVLWLPRADVLVPLVEGCRLDRQACAAMLPGGGRLEVTLEPRPVTASGPLRVIVTVSGLRPEQVGVDFRGVEMNMGLHHLVLEEAGAGRYAAETALPVCVTGKMMWQATVLIAAERKNISVPFRFESGV